MYPFFFIILLSTAMPVMGESAVAQPKQAKQSSVPNNLIPLPEIPELPPVTDTPPSSPPEVPDIQPDPELETQVTIIKRGEDTIEEHRVKGKLYKQHVQPAKGLAYTLIDEKGDGKFVRADGPELKFAVPMWVLVEWK